MSCIQVAPSPVLPSISVSKYTALSRLPSKPCSLRICSNNPATASKYSKGSPVVKYKYRAPVCLFAGGGLSNNGTEGSQSQPLEKAAESFKKKSIEEMIREQIQKGEYAVDPFVDGGGKPPRGDGGGGGRDRGRGRGRGWGDDKSEGKDMNEALQVALATIGFVLVYLSTIHGEDVILLARDYIKFISTGKRTVRLRKVMEWFSQRRRPAHEIEEDEDNDEDEYAFQ